MTLNLAKDKIANGLVIEASAGTGKTYTVAALVTRELALDDKLRIGHILITTFTRNAAAELRERIRLRLIATAAMLRSSAPVSHDDLDVHLLNAGAEDLKSRANRLERAVVEFDNATISTIHKVCSRVLKAAGLELKRNDDNNNNVISKRVVAEVVNDLVVAEMIAGQAWDEGKIIQCVHAMRRDQFIKPWFDTKDHDPETHRRLRDAGQLVCKCIASVRDALLATPSYDDLVHRAYDVVTDPGHESLTNALQERFAMAIIDEAQDTDALQWALFRKLFPQNGPRPLVAVGDPKQSIYSFRGADVQAYMKFAESAPRQTLTNNYRSDKPLIDVLNRSLAKATFGPDIFYRQVVASDRHAESQHIGTSAAVEFIDLGEINNQEQLAVPVARKVLELLNSAQLFPANPRRVAPSDVCVLVRAAAVGRSIERQLRRFGVRAVSNGTESVMVSPMAGDIRALFEAMERGSNMGRIRRVAATAFFGLSLRDAGLLGDDAMLAVQDRISELLDILQHSGIAGCEAAITADAEMMGHLTSGDCGERNFTDFSHIMEILHEAGTGKGCTPAFMLEVFLELFNTKDTSEVVTRRVESDTDAVKIMTIHTAKGLEFPCVIVADLWKPAKERSEPAIFYQGKKGGKRVIDIAFAIGAASESAKAAAWKIQNDELRRLIYVALTRAKHHLCVMSADTVEDNILRSVLTSMPPMRDVDDLPPLTAYTPHSLSAAPQTLSIAASPNAINQTYSKMSFTSIASSHRKEAIDLFSESGNGSDELHVRELELTTGLTIADLPAGASFGSTVHKILEEIDTDRPLELEHEVRRVVHKVATSALLMQHHDSLSQMIVDAMQTPFGGKLGDVCYASVATKDRLAEMDFDMSLTSLRSKVLVSDIGKVLLKSLPSTDVLSEYAEQLSGREFDIPFGGLLSGSIDAVLRIRPNAGESLRLIITDYKTNKLHTSGAAHPMEAYSPDKLVKAMAHNHYPLQALLYGTALYRMLRWRVPASNADECIVGIAYGFMRGMKGPNTPSDKNGYRYGLFSWTAPPGLWSCLSNLFSGKLL